MNSLAILLSFCIQPSTPQAALDSIARTERLAHPQSRIIIVFRECDFKKLALSEETR